MDETNEVYLETENQDYGGETVENQATGSPAGKDWQKIAEDQKKRAEIAEAKLAEAAKLVTTSQEQPAQQPINVPEASSEFLTREEGLLLARGYSDDAIAHAKKIAKGADVPLLDALNDPLMTAFLEKEAEEKRKQAASLGASQGSGVTPTKEVPLDADAHKKYWQEKMSRK